VRRAHRRADGSNTRRTSEIGTCKGRQRSRSNGLTSQGRLVKQSKEENGLPTRKQDQRSAPSKRETADKRTASSMSPEDGSGDDTTTAPVPRSYRRKTDTGRAERRTRSPTLKVTQLRLAARTADARTFDRFDGAIPCKPHLGSLSIVHAPPPPSKSRVHLLLWSFFET
jgi:hypothetical protein